MVVVIVWCVHSTGPFLWDSSAPVEKLCTYIFAKYIQNLWIIIHITPFIMEYKHV